MVSIADVIFIQSPGIDILHNPQELLLQGPVHMLVEHVDICLLGELVPDGGLFDADGVGQDCRHWTRVGGFYENRGGQGHVHHR